MLIGITGTLGAGKGTVVEYLVQRRGMRHHSVRGFLIEEIQRRGMLVDRDAMVIVANDFRERHRPSYIIEQLHLQALSHGLDAIIESVRALGEARYLKSHDARIWAVDAQPEIRYHRIISRASETDRVSFERFLADEEREFRSSDPTKQNIRGVMDMADTTFHNDGTPEELHAQIESVLA